MEVQSNQPTTGMFYAKNSSVQHDLGVEFIHRVLEPQAGQSILDLGCGTGQLAMLLATLVGTTGRVLAVDPDQSRISIAKKTAVQSKLDNITVVHGDIYSVSSLGPFDSVFTNFVLHWVSEAELSHTLVMLHKCLAPGGHVAGIITLTPGRMVKLLADKLNGQGTEEASGMLVRTADFWKNLFLKTGFEINYFHEREEKHSF
eukprot:scpid101304/ scgid6538/ Demethylmenaquinone methyltransferase; Menaquinone biosynthesis methyltransferase ubiE